MDMYTKADFIDVFGVLQYDMFKVAEGHGFHEKDENPLYVPTALALITSEVSEALEAHRKQETDKLPSELADIVIRTMDLAESLKIDLAKEIIRKHEVNKDRPFKHGNKLY